MAAPDKKAPPTVQRLRERLLAHVDEFLSLPISERTATGLKACTEIVVAIGEVVEKRTADEVRRSISATKLPFAVDENGRESPTAPRGPRVPGIDP